MQQVSKPDFVDKKIFIAITEDRRAYLVPWKTSAQVEEEEETLQESVI
jgi:hypothetical protein